MQINFELYCDKTEEGDVVKVCGNIPELGNWYPENALTLFTTPPDYPKWKNNFILDKIYSYPIEYKYFIFKNNLIDD